MKTYSESYFSGKYDKGKLDYTLIPPVAMEGAAQVLTFGASKYGANTWKDVENGKQRYLAACMRHIEAHRRGELLDNESGISHLAHAMTNLMFLLELHSV